MGSSILSLLLLAAPLVRASPRPASHERRSEAGAAASQYGRRVAIPGLEQRGYSAFMKPAEPFEKAVADEGGIQSQSTSVKLIRDIQRRIMSWQYRAWKAHHQVKR
jgi:hypothetical protein